MPDEGNHFDYCVDLVGGNMTALATESLILNGYFADVTALGTEKSRSILFDKGAVIFNISNYAYSLFSNLECYGQMLNRISNKLEKGEIKAPKIKILNGLTTDAVATAHLMLERNETKGRKIVMQMD